MPATYPGWRPDPTSGATYRDGKWYDKDGNEIQGEGQDTASKLNPATYLGQAGTSFAKPAVDALGYLDPARGNETLAAAYGQAQQQAGALADLQWSRQMEGLGGALGHAAQQQSLWNSVYGGPAGGGSGMPARPTPSGPTTSQAPLTRPTYDGRNAYPNYAQNPPNTNPDIQKIFEDLQARGGPGAIPTTSSTFAPPNPATGRPTYQMPQPSSNSFIGAAPPSPNAPPPPPPPSGITQASSPLTVAPPPPAPRPSLDSILGRGMAPAPPGAAGPTNPFVATAPLPPPPPLPPAMALPGLADFLPQTNTPVSPLRKISGWGGF